MVNPMSQGNYLRLISTEPAAVQEREGFFDRLNNDMAFQLMIKESFGALLPNNYALSASAWADQNAHHCTRMCQQCCKVSTPFHV